MGFKYISSWYTSIKRFKSGRWIKVIISGTVSSCYRDACRPARDYPIILELGWIKICPWWTLDTIKDLFLSLREPSVVTETLNQWSLILDEDYNRRITRYSDIKIDNFQFSLLPSSTFGEVKYTLPLDEIYNFSNKCLYKEIYSIALGKCFHNKIENCIEILLDRSNIISRVKSNLLNKCVSVLNY